VLRRWQSPIQPLGYTMCEIVRLSAWHMRSAMTSHGRPSVLFYASDPTYLTRTADAKHARGAACHLTRARRTSI